MVKTISTSEARKNLASLLQEVATTGVEYSILKNDVEVARIVPPSAGIDPGFKLLVDEFMDEHAEAMKRLANA